MSDEQRTHLLIVGAPRSGTTLLTTLIGHHPEARMMSECVWHEHRKQIGGRVVGNKLCIPNQIKLEPERGGLEYPENVKSLIKDKPNLVARLSLAARWILGRLPYRTVCIRDYVERWDAKLIGIVRNPDHVIHSMQQRAGWSPEKAKRHWAEAVTSINTLHHEYPERTHLVVFSDLVSQPERVLRDACTFLDLEFDDRMLYGHRGATMYDGTSQYARDRIDPEVATKSVPDSKVKQNYPKAFEMYETLTAAVALS
jgi:hypothetical protein